MTNETNKKKDVHGFRVEYKDNANEGVDYLKNDLDRNESRVFFDQAKRRGSAMFEDDNDRQFIIHYKNGVYYLDRR